MANYTADFSTGQMRFDNRNDGFVAAVAIISNKTGEIRNITLSNKPNPSPNWTGIIRVKTRYMTEGYLKFIENYNREAKEAWTVEVVPLQKETS